ncbi:MAG: metallophosphoesterase [Candidatus Hodarchaeota archaeon]
MVLVKIGVCGDPHADYELFEIFLNKALAKHIDLLILPGDFCNGRTLPDDATTQDFIDQLEPINTLLAKISTPIFFILGNHDPIELAETLSLHRHIKNIHGKNVDWNGYIIGGIGGSHYITPQLQNKTVPFPEGRIPFLFNNTPYLEYLKTTHHKNDPYLYSGVHLMYDKIFPCDILISHTPPLLPENKNFHEASVGLYNLIRKHKPLLNLSAHVHEPEIHIKTISWEKVSPSWTTTLVYLGSLDNMKICIIILTKYKKMVEQIEILPID